MTRGRLPALGERVYRDYLQPNRLAELGRFLARARELGYEAMTLSAFAEGGSGPRERVLLIRHDIDSDVATARRMWALERELGAVGSYFFRRATWDVGFMRELTAAGCEVGYHYEELATLVKERGAATPAEARALIAPARERLSGALAELRRHSGLALDVLAAHGDFANRAVHVSNVELLADAPLRAQLGVRLEAYDIEDRVDARCSDNVYPGYWEPEDPTAAIERGARAVEVLVHPRAWGRSPVANARADLGRVFEAARYGLRRARRRR